MNEEQPAPEQSAKPVEAQPAVPPEAQAQDARRRLRRLLAIPDRERTDAVWDEIIGLEIQLAPGNRAPSPPGDGRREPGRRQEPGRRPDQVRRPQSASGMKPARRFLKKSKRGTGTPTGR